MIPKKILLVAFFSLVLSSCQSTFGPGSLENTHPSYNQSLSDILRREMLLNLVRLKYRDEMYFLKVGSVTSSFEFNGHLGVDLGFSAPGGAAGLPLSGVSPSTGLEYKDIPTLSYTPVEGEEYFKSIMTPIPLDSLLVMIGNGWNLDRIFGLCIDRVNDIYNDPASAFANNAEAKKFRKMTALLRKLQESHSIELGGGKDGDKKGIVLMFKTNATNQKTIDELQALLGIKENGKAQQKVIIGSDFLNRTPDEITISTRAMSTIMHYLAQTVDVPPEHKAAGLVSIDKEDPNPDNTPNKNFNVKVSDSRPEGAFIAVPYRGFWYYISDNDIKSKSTFMLLTTLYQLQAGQTKTTSPTLTIPVR